MLLFGLETEFAEGAEGALQELSWCKLSLVLGSLRGGRCDKWPVLLDVQTDSVLCGNVSDLIVH